MGVMMPDQFAFAMGITDRAARKAYANAAIGKTWRGYRLPVSTVSGQRGGSSGKSLALHIDLCATALKDLLTQSENLPATTKERGSIARVKDKNLSIAMDRQRIIAPALALPHRSAERAKVIRDLADQPAHKVGGCWTPLSLTTLYEWIKIAETDTSGLLPQGRSDRGQRRVGISRAWDSGCGLSEVVQDKIAASLEATARGLFAKGRSERNVKELCSGELEKLTVEAGVNRRAIRDRIAA